MGVANIVHRHIQGVVDTARWAADVDAEVNGGALSRQMGVAAGQLAIHTADGLHRFADRLGDRVAGRDSFSRRAGSVGAVVIHFGVDFAHGLLNQRLRPGDHN